MQTTSEAYKTKIKEPSREFNCKITIGTKIFTNDDIVDIILDSPQPSEGFSIGNTPSQTLDLTLLNKEDTIYSANQVKIEIGINTGSTIEYLVLGYFNIDDIEKTDYTTKITAFDNMIKFEKPFFSSISYPATLQAVVNELAAKTGVQFTGSLPSYTLSKLEGFTCREILGYVASLCGGNAVITRDGKFTIVVPQDINYSIGTDNYFDYKREEVKYKISKVSCKAGDTELIKGTLGADSMELTFENPWVTDSILTDIYNKLNGFEYLGYTMKWQGDLSLDIGDIVTCTDIKGVVRKLPLLSQKLTYNGGLTSEIGAKGETKNKNSYNSKGENTKKLERVVTELAIVNKALIDVAYIGDLTAGNIKVDILEGGTAILQDILTNFISGDNGQFIHLTGSNVVIDNAVIKDAMIDTISAGKISAGTMSTNKFTISSDSGNLVIADNTIQIKDGTRVRVQIGKDTSNDYSLYVWDNTGKLMFDALGLKADAIKDKIIRNDMVSDSANISGRKLDIDSVIVEVNTNGTETFKSSKVKMDSTGQTLDVAFTKVSEDAAGAVEIANTAQTDVGIANGKIETLVKNTTIVKEDGTTVQLKDAYTETAQTVSGLATKVTSIDTTVNGTGGLTTRMNTVEQKTTATGITTTISEAINAGTNSITTTQFVMDKTGFTVKNGAITIKDSNGNDILKGNSSGLLTLGGANASGYLNVINEKKQTVATISKNAIYAYDIPFKAQGTYTTIDSEGGQTSSYETNLEEAKLSFYSEWAKDGQVWGNNASISLTPHNEGRSEIVYSAFNHSFKGSMKIEGSIRIHGDLPVLQSYKSDVDLDTMMYESGIYGIYKFTSGPIQGINVDANIATLEVIRYSNDWLIQKLSYITTYGVQVYERARYSGTTWSTWKHIHTVYYDGTIASNQTYVFRNSIYAYATTNDTDSSIINLYRNNGKRVGALTLGANGDNVRLHLYDSAGTWKAYHDFGFDGCILRKNTAVERLTGVASNSYNIGASGNGRIESDASIRIYNSARGSADSGLYIDPDGSSGIKSYNTTRHRFNADGTKTGGTMEIEGTIYGMSPTDSPQTLIEYIEFDVTVDGETEVFLDSIYSKMISKFTAVISNSDIKIKEKRVNSIVLAGTGTTDIVFKGQRKEADQYFRIMNGFITQGYEKEGII